MKPNWISVITATTNFIFQNCAGVKIRPTDRINTNTELSE